LNLLKFAGFGDGCFFSKFGTIHTKTDTVHKKLVLFIQNLVQTSDLAMPDFLFSSAEFLNTRSNWVAGMSTSAQFFA
jgi:hypothetical protein